SSGLLRQRRRTDRSLTLRVGLLLRCPDSESQATVSRLGESGYGVPTRRVRLRWIMHTPSSALHPAIEPWRWRLLWLMFLATMINYMDRQALGSTSEFIKHEFHLDEQGYGWLEFWFGIAYGLFQIPAGFLADRLHMRWPYAAALLLWSSA